MELTDKIVEIAPANRHVRRRARTTTAILNAAERLFLSRGYATTTVEQLAAEADVAVGSVYGHFGGKEGVYAGLIDRALELDKRYSDEGWETGETPVARLLGIGDGYLQFAREHPGYYRLFRFPPLDRPSGGPVDEAATRVAEHVRAEVERIAGAIAEATDGGEIRRLDPRHAAAFLWAAWDGVIAAHLLPGNMGLSDEDFDAVLEIARDALLRGLAAGEAGS